MEDLQTDLKSYVEVFEKEAPAWKDRPVLKDRYDGIDFRQIGVESYSTKTFQAFYETIIFNLMKAQQNQGEATVSSGFNPELSIYLEPSEMEASKYRGSSTAAESSSRADGNNISIFKQKIDSEITKYVKVKTDEQSFKPKAPKMLDLDQVKETNMKHFIDESSLKESYLKGLEEEEMKRAIQLENDIAREKKETYHDLYD